MTSIGPDSRENGNSAQGEEGKTVKPTMSRADRQASNVSQGKEAAATAAPPKKPGRLAKMGFTPIDLPTFLLMVKGAVAPTIGIAIYQSTAVANYFTTLGYLVGIISILSVPILPRGKFLQNVVLNIIFVCAGAAMGILILWSSLQARLHTQTGPAIDPVTRRPTYNSSQSAVSGVWLFVSIWFVNVLRAKYPTLNVPVILYSILTSISCTFSPQMTSNAAFESVIRRILVAMLAAMGLATGASLLVFPLPSRKVTYGQMKAAIGLMRGAVKQEKAYLQSLENEDMFAEPVARWRCCSPAPPGPAPKLQQNNRAEAEQVKQTIASLRQLSGKMQADLPFAKRDFAWGKLDGCDVKMLFYHLRSCLIPIVGLSTVIDIFQRIAERRGWNTDSNTPDDVVEEKNAEKRIWNEIMKQLHEPLETLSEALDQGLEHAGMVLEILPRPKKAKKSAAGADDADVEAKGDMVKPGDPEFARTLEEKVKSFEAVKVDILRSWAEQRGLAYDESADGADLANMPSIPSSGNRHQRDQFQLFLLLYIEKLMAEVGDSVRGFVAFADQKVADGTMSKNRLIIPKYRRIKKWVSSIFSSNEGESSTTENNDLLDTTNIVYMGDSFAAKKDPEHLPPVNWVERVGEGVRAVSRFFSSEASTFGIRVACATMTIGIVNFLESTQQFFQEQRGYIVDQKTPGILVFLFVFLVFEHYFLLKFPQFTPAVMICMVTHVMIIGYELQVLKLGIPASEASGQVYYPIYVLAPYRLACVAAGCAVAFFWTVFPSPLTERTWIRRDLSATLYLLANYFSVIDESLKSKLHGTGGDPRHKRSPHNRLKKHRQLLLGKLLLLLPSLKQHADWQRWEPTVGGAFPRDVYEDIIKRATRIVSYLTLMAHTVGYAPPGQQQGAEPDRAWIEALAELMADVVPTKRGIVCTLTLLSHSLQTGHSLPPNLPLPRPFALTRRLGMLAARRHRRGRSDSSSGSSSSSSSSSTGDESESDREEEAQASPSTSATATRSQAGGPFGLLDAKHMAENGYAEFAVLQVCSSLICDDLEDLVRDVSKLVGVVDFSFRVEGSSSTFGGGNSTDEDGKGKRD
ncbi:uncharacterized protein PG986_015127 [Apiospora aurea]|uniref:Putative ER transporter 6TM N-terminal domain-containing protein n=1 Tax=Apiospora aurea TaxID=335848 RepID=A0ABR1PRP3_9PEZI